MNETRKKRNRSPVKRGVCVCCCVCLIFAVALLVFITYHGLIMLVFFLDAQGGSTPACRSYFVPPDEHRDTNNISNPLSSNSFSNISHLGYRMNQARTVGLHNSYHIMNSFFSATSWASYMCVFVSQWSYTHPSLSDQLSQGYRVFEIDLHARDDALMVYHVQLFDQLTTCYCLSECLREVNVWSETNPWHFPIFLLFEFKNGKYDDSYIYRGNQFEFRHISSLEQEIVQELGGKLLTPQLLRGNYSSLIEAINATGWPLISEVRGRIVAVLWESSGLLDTYLDAARSDEPILFTIERPDNQVNAAIGKFDDPLGNQLSINSSVELGYLVRTRVDEYLNLDSERRLDGLTSKAQLLMTDIVYLPLFDDLKKRCSILSNLTEFVCIP